MRSESLKIYFLKSVIRSLITGKPSFSSCSCPKTEATLPQLSNLRIKLNQLHEIAMLPPSLETKIQALQKIQLEMMSKEAVFHKHVHSLEMEFLTSIGELYEKRKQIVSGTYQPIKKDLLNPEDFEISTDAQLKGVPEFWLTVFKKTPVLQCMIWEADEPALKHLVDVQAVMFDQPKEGFTLQFEFEPNDFFSNEVLTKKYLMECVPNDEEPSKFTGFEIYDTVGCEIDWKEGFKLTAQGAPGVERRLNSFFNFFDPMRVLEDCDPLVRKHFLETDFEIGYFIKERLVPRAVLFYNGDMSDDEDEPMAEEVVVSEEIIVD
ncbi:nucleosome assembly protein 1-like 1 [Ochlerotatus camptorhynchus]|uniref:nucleosome assembly protein 1-like 1 n=1 Tax=Ochlerotatus camptorhynchus TaxID=644619 RepID=UPI0031D11B2D